MEEQSAAQDHGGTIRGDARRTIAVATPLYLSMIALSIGALVNTAVLGRFGTADLAAFALVGAVYIPANAAVSGAVRGVMPFVSASAGNPSRVMQVVRDGTWLAILVGLLGATSVAGVGRLARFAGVPAVTIDRLGYYPWMMAGAVLLASIGSMASSSLVGLGRNAVVMRVGIVSAAATAGVALVLVNGLGPVPAMGLTGSGLAVVAANAITCLSSLVGLSRSLSTSLRSFAGRLDLGRVVELAKVGVPMAGTVLVKFGVLGVLAFAAARISAPAAAAHSIATSLGGLTFIVAIAVGQAGIPLISGRAATGDTAGVRSAVRSGLLVSGIALSVLCALLWVLSPVYLPSFTDDPAVISIMMGLLPVVALSILGDGLQAVVGFGLTGLKRTVPSFMVFAALYGLLALVAVPLAAAAGVIGLWAALAVVNLLVFLGQGAAFLRVIEGLRHHPR
ncbi:MATE family efflux transporter [Actinoplanes sp. NPDC051859]|uniref:MATE family efflux transporter n=1 Tax=Actinoplanes sp. NPDC051859 TaxID=3363909 RepID=UPI00379416A7